MSTRPNWRLPEGVSRGVWDYVHTHSVATDYDRYFADHQLFRFDERFVLRTLEQHHAAPGALIGDLGCGSGRLLVAICQAGYRGLAIDLSATMLDVVHRKRVEMNLPIDCLRANLVQLDGLRDSCLDYAISMFSTLGMIQGRQHRQQALWHVARILKPGGLFIFHVHNYWFNLWDPGGPWWLLRNLWQSATRQMELGDKYYPYRGVANMYLHVFTRGELRAAMRNAGLTPVEWLPLSTQLSGPLGYAWFASGVRASGWIVVCRSEK